MKDKVTPTTQLVRDALITTTKEHELFGEYPDGTPKIKDNHLERTEGSLIVKRPKDLRITRDNSLKNCTRINAEEAFDFLMALKWSDVTDEVIELGCAMVDDEDTPEEDRLDVKYYRANFIPTIQGVSYGIGKDWSVYEAVTLVGELEASQLSQIRIHPSHHSGYELVMDTIPPQSTSTIHCIVGNCKCPDPAYPPELDEKKAYNRRVVYTWFPGRMTAPMSHGITDKSPVKLIDQAVDPMESAMKEALNATMSQALKESLVQMKDALESIKAHTEEGTIPWDISNETLEALKEGE